MKTDRFGNALATLYLLIESAVILSTGSFGLLAFVNFIFLCCFSATGDITVNGFGKTIYLLSVISFISLAVYFSLTLLSWFWLWKLLFGLLMGYGLAIVSMLFSAMNRQINPSQKQ